MHDELDDIFNALDNLEVEQVGSFTPRAEPTTIKPIVNRRLAPKKQPAKSIAVDPELKDVPVVKEDEGHKQITVQSMKVIAEDIFGEENVEVSGNNSLLTLTIHFPKFDIRNSKGNVHTIRDLYVRFHVRYSANGKIQDVSMLGVRACLTTEEIDSLYGHSHLPSDAAAGKWQTFCQGSSKFKAITTNLITDSSQDQWTLALLAVKPYIQWESLEGGPHKRIAEIAPSNRRSAIDYASTFRGIATKLPLDIFELRDQLCVNTESSKLRDFYDEHSPVKMVHGAAGSTTAALDRWRSNYRMELSSFRNAPVSMRIVHKDELEGMDDPHISAEVVDALNSQLQQYLTNFNTNFNYEYAKHTFSKNLGQVPTFKQADINYYKTSAGAHRLPARTGWRKRVVGRVDHIRKREDNRFG